MKELIEELQMMTGVVSVDLEYLVALLLCEESGESNQTSESLYVSLDEVECATEIDDWFNNLDLV